MKTIFSTTLNYNILFFIILDYSVFILYFVLIILINYSIISFCRQNRLYSRVIQISLDKNYCS